VVVDDFDIVRIARPPAKTDTPLRVYPNAVLASSIPFELLQTIAGRQPQVVEDRGSTKHAELSERDLLNVDAQFPHGAALVETLRVSVTEALDHTEP
jgi:hypothetical protein